jgi:hypothetical protein
MHIRQQKHAKNMLSKYYCETCDYRCSVKFLWSQHISTRKHKTATQATTENTESEKHICLQCGKEYKQRSGLWRHKKKCVQEPEPVPEPDMNLLITEMMNHMKTQSEHIKNQTKIINEMIPKIGNSNRFNINIFLNEQCKDAINMSEFLDSLKIQMTDINYIRDNGLMDGISNVFIKGLEQLETYKRPIHCTDIKRETLYIKDNNEWERNGREKLKHAIVDVTKKHRVAITQWEKYNPNWNMNDKGKDDYVKIVQHLMEDTLGNENKIIRNISKSIIIDDVLKITNC